MKTITRPQKLSEEMRMLITQVVRDTLSDPDFGRELTEKAKKRLVRSRADIEDTITEQEVLRWSREARKLKKAGKLPMLHSLRDLRS